MINADRRTHRQPLQVYLQRQSSFCYDFEHSFEHVALIDSPHLVQHKRVHPLIVLLILDFSVFNYPLLVDAHTSHHHEVTEILHSFALHFLLLLVFVVILGFAFSFLISKQDIRESFTKISKRMVGLIELLAYELAGVFNSTLKCIFLAVGH